MLTWMWKLQNGVLVFSWQLHMTTMHFISGICGSAVGQTKTNPYLLSLPQHLFAWPVVDEGAFSSYKRRPYLKNQVVHDPQKRPSWPAFLAAVTSHFPLSVFSLVKHKPGLTQKATAFTRQCLAFFSVEQAYLKLSHFINS